MSAIPCLRRRFPVPAALLLGAAFLGCGEDAAGPSETESADPVAVVVRRASPDANSFQAPLSREPRTDLEESGEWLPEYSDAALYRITAEGWFLSRTTGDPVPVLVRTDGSATAGSLQIGVNPRLSLLRVFGLRKHDVWVRITVYPVV